MKLKRWISSVGLICVSFALSTSVFAVTVGGVTVTKKSGTLAQGYNIEFFTDFSLSTKWGTITDHIGEFIANESGSSTINDGWIPISGITGEKTISIIVGTATGIGTGTVRIEGKTGTTTNAHSWIVYDYTFSGSTTAGIKIAEYLDAIKVSYNIEEIGTDTVNIFGSFLGQTENL